MSTLFCRSWDHFIMMKSDNGHVVLGGCIVTVDDLFNLVGCPKASFFLEQMIDQDGQLVAISSSDEPCRTIELAMKEKDITISELSKKTYVGMDLIERMIDRSNRSLMREVGPVLSFLGLNPFTFGSFLELEYSEMSRNRNQ